MSNTETIIPNIISETGTLKQVVLGLAEDFGGTPKIDECFDPTSKYFIKKNLYPSQKNISKEVYEFYNLLIKHGIEVLRPKNVTGINQVFARDLGFVIENFFLISNIIENREHELPAIIDVISSIKFENVLNIPSEVIIEGGDVTIFKNHIFIGYSSDEDVNKFKVARTNAKAISFLAQSFPEKKVKGFELHKSDNNKNENTLHLDCCFQPVGSDKAIIATDAFKNQSDILYLENLFGKKNLFYLSNEEKNEMNSNIFSISPKIVVSDVRFERLNNWLTEIGLKVEAIKYEEVAKMGGLFRCSTLPLIRN